jgi:hypothetical protein
VTTFELAHPKVKENIEREICTGILNIPHFGRRCFICKLILCISCWGKHDRSHFAGDEVIWIKGTTKYCDLSLNIPITTSRSNEFG